MIRRPKIKEPEPPQSVQTGDRSGSRASSLTYCFPSVSCRSRRALVSASEMPQIWPLGLAVQLNVRICSGLDFTFGNFSKKKETASSLASCIYSCMIAYIIIQSSSALPDQRFPFQEGTCSRFYGVIDECPPAPAALPLKATATVARPEPAEIRPQRTQSGHCPDEARKLVWLSTVMRERSPTRSPAFLSAFGWL